MQYCLPIIKNTKAEVLRTITEGSGYDMYEVWLDYITDLDDEFATDLINRFPNKLLFLFRRQNLETPHMSIDKRLQLINKIAKNHCFIDLDISQEKELEYSKTNYPDQKLLISYHNYKETPNDKDLLEIVQRIETYTPTIVKVATMCNNANDAVRLLELLLKLKEQQKNYIILGMGNYGQITRIYGTLWGNVLTFAPKTKTDSSAPGQLSKEEMETVLKILNT